jgi:hypothetical protein
MNLHSVVGPIVGAVNPNLAATIQLSNGTTKDAAFKQIPAYLAAQAVTVQMQPLGYKDLLQVEGINVGGGKLRAFYLSGNAQAVSRVAQKGGDLITLPDGTLWLTVQVLEDFSVTSGWVKVAATLQMPS